MDAPATRTGSARGLCSIEGAASTSSTVLPYANGCSAGGGSDDGVVAARADDDGVSVACEDDGSGVGRTTWGCGPGPGYTAYTTAPPVMATAQTVIAVAGLATAILKVRASQPAPCPAAPMADAAVVGAAAGAARVMVKCAPTVAGGGTMPMPASSASAGTSRDETVPQCSQ